ncbi:ST3 beta-galactoside alpha-2,3-sialyltransferase 7 [Acipenser ruthenus]|nr:ST3 beta-galactoside alpha-2,3-sialyltransferase 7 [Acipenser ruthenus]XP_033881628.2 ST3 beta-galactoside alpha-2,3-sialyltransferase 7 [Acipenser ruthenus]
MELAKSTDFFLSREKNLTLSIVLLVGCYTALLYPAYFPRQPTIWREYSMQHELVEVLQNRSNSLLSQACRPGWSRLKLKEAYPGQLPPGIPVFLQRGEGGWSQAHSERFLPPLGLHGSEEQAARALQGLPQTSLSPELGGGGLCRRCVVLGSGGVLRGSRLGPHIDRHHVIMRLNSAPVSGFEEDVGYRTTVRLTYPEGAPHSARQYSNTSLLVMAMYKSSDLDWFTAVVAKQPLGWWTKLWFWQTVVESIPLHAENFRILNPEIIRETALGFLGYPKPQQSLISLSQVPTLGVTAVVMAIRLCDEVSLAGFGYDLKHPMTPLHYYGTLRMNAMGLQSVHDVGAEKMFLRSLVQAAAVNDLTGGISW